MNNVQAKFQPNPKKSGRRDELIETTKVLIAERGLRSLKVREVATAAGCALGSIYNDFGDFDGLILEVSRDTVRHLTKALSEADDPSPVRHLHRLAEGYLDFATSHPNLLRALFEHRMENDKPFPQDLLDMVQGAFALMYKPLSLLLSELPHEQVAMLAKTMFSAVHGIISLGLEERLVAVPPEMLRIQLSQFVTTHLGGLGIGEPSA